MHHLLGHMGADWQRRSVSENHPTKPNHEAPSGSGFRRNSEGSRRGSSRTLHNVSDAFVPSDVGRHGRFAIYAVHIGMAVYSRPQRKGSVSDEWSSERGLLSGFFCFFFGSFGGRGGKKKGRYQKPVYSNLTSTSPSPGLGISMSFLIWSRAPCRGLSSHAAI